MLFGGFAAGLRLARRLACEAGHRHCMAGRAGAECRRVAEKSSGALIPSDSHIHSDGHGPGKADPKLEPREAAGTA